MHIRPVIIAAGALGVVAIAATAATRGPALLGDIGGPEPVAILSCFECTAGACRGVSLGVYRADATCEDLANYHSTMDACVANCAASQPAVQYCCSNASGDCTQALPDKSNCQDPSQSTTDGQCSDLPCAPRSSLPGGMGSSTDKQAEEAGASSVSSKYAEEAAASSPLGSMGTMIRSR